MTSLGNDGVTYGDFNRLQQQKQLIGQELTRWGFSDVRVNEAEISASKNGARVSVAHLTHPSPDRWWEVIMCCCDGSDVDLARTTVTQASNAIKRTW
ncbi:hypothetical protein [Mycolicibacterium sp. HK-90]|uniref:hypothetical protein n=1 Tax=Mycolicibacterium sp. HK-90 TaxID=3056937 RepID=UPI002659670F|nr:hypothetical protein [Mycolicibacterium sp. HK-90]WKG04965.1 hypothetical protein QU592_07730 [Mycolicibacterium sp. HK-90]